MLREGAQGAWRPWGTGLPVAFTPFVFTCEAETRTPAGLWLRPDRRGVGWTRGRRARSGPVDGGSYVRGLVAGFRKTVVAGSWARGLRRLSALSSRDSRELKLF